MPLGLARAARKPGFDPGRATLSVVLCYVQALKDAQMLDQRYCSFVQSQLQKIWLGLAEKFSAIPRIALSSKVMH